MKRVVLAVIFLFTSAPVPLYAGNFEFKNQQSLRYDISVDNEDWYITRFWAESYYNSPAVYNTFKSILFVETRYHFHSHKLCRTEIGIEVGTDLFEWFYPHTKIFGVGVYWGESLQYATLHPGRDTFELESILLLTFPFRIRSHELEFYVLEEHTFAFVTGEGKRNEVGLGISWVKTSNGAKENFEVLLGWRHTDRIHYYDSDQIEASLIFTF